MTEKKSDDLYVERVEEVILALLRLLRPLTQGDRIRVLSAAAAFYKNMA